VIIRRVAQDKRLGYYSSRADSDFWDSEWFDRVKPDLFSKAEAGFLGDFEKPFLKYLPQTGRILEAGCGLARNVVALRHRGYDCEGIDYAEQTIQLVKKIKPDLPIRVGDVTRLDVPDGYYTGYISLGVVEHLEEGPESFLKEANRVLSEDGVAYISVPYFHRLRQLKSFLGFYKEPIDGLEFYQYAFSQAEMVNLLQKNGFQVIDIHGYGSWKGLKDELPFLTLLYKTPKIGGIYRIMTQKTPFCDRYFGHMVGFICKKQA